MWAWLARPWYQRDRSAPPRAEGASPDVVGLNYYPELSCRELVRLDGTVVHVAYDGGVELLERALWHWHSRFGGPLMITETAIEGERG